MIFVLQAAVVLGFPACAVWASRTGGRRRLWLAVGAWLVGTVGVALAAAAPRFGNRLADHYGYPRTAMLTVLLGGLTVGLPVVVGALVVQSCRGWVARAYGLYVLGAIGALVAFVLGTAIVVHLLPALL